MLFRSYTYATGYNSSLNQMINEILSRNGTLTETDIDQVYETCISPSRFTDRIDHVGSQVMAKCRYVGCQSQGAKGKPLVRVGRKATDLLRGSRVATKARLF